MSHLPLAPSAFAAPATPSSTSTSNRNRPPSPKFSAATEDILRRINANGATPNSMPGFEAVKESILKGMVTSDKIPVPPPSSNAKRGRPAGRGSANSASRTAGAPGPESSTRGRRRGRARGRGRGRGGGRGGKRKRDESEAESELTQSDEQSDQDPFLIDDDDDDDGKAAGDEDDYAPLPTTTKSGRSVHKPAHFVPSIPSPVSASKRRKPYRRNPDSALCKACHRGHSPNNNQIVFCDGCGAAYHQYCHDPPIDKETVLVPDKEWLCAACVRTRMREVAGTALDGLESGDKMSDLEKREHLSSLPHDRLVDMLVHASALYPPLPLFSPSQPGTNGAASMHLTAAEDEDEHQQQQHYDGYDTDPPAHYPRPGNGLARTLRPESEDLEFLVDAGADVFSHEFHYPSDDANGVGDVDLSMGGA